ncbi:MAG: DUF58 domain-containing protein [Armatimonadota bacterium]|jgi:uncharacterized protein (DUF58 family)
MWTQKARIVLFGVVSFYVIALVNESFVLYAVCSAGAALLGICYLLAGRSLRGLSCHRTLLVDRLVEGGTLPVRMTVQNADGRARREVVVTDPIVNLTSGTAARRYEILVPEVPPAGETIGRGDYTCPERGRYRVGPLTLRGGDPLGLFRPQQEFELRDTVVAYPRTFDMPAGLLRGGTLLSMHDAQRAPARGHGHEFRAIREYVEGDDLRWVHWRTTAHLGRLTIKEFESGAAASVTIIVDLSKAGKHGAAPNSTIDYAARIASSIARDAVLRGGFVRLRGNAKAAIATPLERGDAHLHRILAILAEVDGNGDASVAALVAAQQPSIPAGSEAVLITAVPDEGLTRRILPLLDNNVGVAVLLLAAHTFAHGRPEAGGAATASSERRGSASRRPRAPSHAPSPDVPYAPHDYGRLARRLHALGARVAIIEAGADLPVALASVVRWHGSGAVAPGDRRIPAPSRR